MNEIFIEIISAGTCSRLRTDALDDSRHVAQTAASLRVADLARALPGPDAGVDLSYHGTRTLGLQLGPNRCRCMPETVTDRNMLIVGMLLMHRLAQLIFAISLVTVARKVDDRTFGGGAKAVFVGLKGRQADAQEGLDRLDIDAPALFPTEWAKAD